MNHVAFGGIVWRERGEEFQLLLVHRPRYDDWSFPKGIPLPGETPEETALREVEEETGLRCRLGQPIGRKTYELPDGSLKTCRFWAMSAISGDFEPNRETDAVQWVYWDRAPQVLTYESDRDLLGELNPGWHEPVSRLIVVRHAHAGTRDDSDPADRDRPLSDQGRQESEGLVAALYGERIDKLLSSPYPRCTQTLEPLSKARELPISEVDDLSEDSPERGLVYLAEREAVLCTHGKVIPLMLDSLLEDGCEFLSPRKWEKGSTWVIDFDGELAVRARYVGPPR